MRPGDPPSHGLEHRLGQVVGGHDNVSGVVGATPGEDGMEVVVCGLPLFQGPVAQVHKELHIREPHLDRGEQRAGSALVNEQAEKNIKEGMPLTSSGLSFFQ